MSARIWQTRRRNRRLARFVRAFVDMETADSREDYRRAALRFQRADRLLGLDRSRRPRD